MKIGIFYGGNSTEHEISILSTLQLLKYFQDEVMLVYVSKDHHFYIGDCLKDFDFYRNLKLTRCQEVVLEKKYQDVYLKEKGIFKKKHEIEMAFVIMHGTAGEDGGIQGLFELLNLPYTQSCLSTCALFLDKDLMRKMFKVFHVPCTPSITLYKEKAIHQLDLLKEIEIQKPWIVKPSKGGSSIGISCIYEDQQMNRLICEAFAFDHKLIVEEKLENIREFNIAVIGNEHEQIVSNIEEIHVNHDYYSYSDKYGGSIVKQRPATRSMPANLEESLKNEIINLSKKCFVDFECSGVVRFDYLYSDHLMLNEINIIPGSLSYYLFKGICTPVEMIELLKKYAMHKYQKKMREIHEIDSFVFKRTWNKELLNK